MPDILLNQVTFRYGKKTVFDQYSLILSGTGIQTVTGPSGCGKTTLFRLLLKLVKPVSGTVSVSEPPAASFQEYRLFPGLTAAQNVAAAKNKPLAETVGDAASLLGELGFTEADCASLPDALSGGMKQRVSVARALFSSASILLFDEPSKELDADLRKSLYAMLRRRADSALILLSTHREEETALLAAGNIAL